MNRREEVEKLVEELSGELYPFDCPKVRRAKQIIDCLEALALASIPTQYTPREEVTAGWYFAKDIRTETRVPVWIWSDYRRRNDLYASVVHSSGIHLLAEFTDFLPVPAWLVEGLNDSETPKGSN